ncbi:ATP-binding cassette domain-containing protein [Corynebacterium sp. 335C]
MSATPLLELRGVTIAVDDHVICRDVDLTIGEGECHILLGPNGSGKSTLLNAVMGVGPFEVTEGTILLRGEDVTAASAAERARAGIGLAFQHPPAIAGVSVGRLAQAIGAGDRVDAASDHLGLGHLADRDVGAGFSGGEQKRWEVMKLELQGPSLCLFDEPESGVDLQQVGVVGGAVNRLLSQPDGSGAPRSAIVITHTGFILDHVDATAAHLMVGGRIVRSGDPREMFEEIRRDGYPAA